MPGTVIAATATAGATIVTTGNATIAATVTAAAAAGDKPSEMQFDDKFYDLDDGWICDDDVAANDDGVDNFMNDQDSHSLTAVAASAAS